MQSTIRYIQPTLPQATLFFENTQETQVNSRLLLEKLRSRTRLQWGYGCMQSISDILKKVISDSWLVRNWIFNVLSTAQGHLRTITIKFCHSTHFNSLFTVKTILVKSTNSVVTHNIKPNVHIQTSNTNFRRNNPLVIALVKQEERNAQTIKKIKKQVNCLPCLH